MLTFHEGLPRSGKSYEALAKHIVPALKIGRPVQTNIKGIDHAKIATLAGISEESCRSLLDAIAWEDSARPHTWAKKNALIVLDELQDFWPVSKAPLPVEIREFVTQHGHLGIDIIALGQDHRDCHATWKRRIQNVMRYTKLTAVGLEDQYTWVAYSAVAPEKFQKISSGRAKYDPQFFGCYASHEPGVTNVGNYKDARMNIWNSAFFRFVLPAFGVVLLVAIVYLVSFFKTGPVAVKEARAATPAPQAVAPATAKLNWSQLEPFNPKARDDAPIEPQRTGGYVEGGMRVQVDAGSGDYLEGLFSKYRARLSAVVWTSTRSAGEIEFLDGSYRAQERLTFTQVRSLGWTVVVVPHGVDVVRGSIRKTVTAWPIDPFGTIAQNVRHSPEISGQPLAGTGR